jgi:hypothetical protein
MSMVQDICIPSWNLLKICNCHPIALNCILKFSSESLSKVLLQVRHSDPKISFLHPKLGGQRVSRELKPSKNLYPCSTIVKEKYKKK